MCKCVLYCCHRVSTQFQLTKHLSIHLYLSASFSIKRVFQFIFLHGISYLCINPLTPNGLDVSRTAPLTSKRCILYIYSTNVGTEYFKRALYSPFFFSSKCSLFHNANCFGSCIIHILYTECAEIKKNNSGAKGLKLFLFKLLQKDKITGFKKQQIWYLPVKKGYLTLWRRNYFFFNFSTSCI